MPDLAGCGPLLASWRQVADLLVPLLHRVSSDLQDQAETAAFTVRPG